MQPVKAPISLAFGTVLLLAGLGIAPATAQNKKNDCKHPPKILSQPKFSDEDRSKWKGKSVTGRVAIVVSEEGDVTQARVVSASPKEAAESLLNAAKQAKFAPRPGCGDLKTEVVFSLNQ
jgi:TonB family protein